MKAAAETTPKAMNASGLKLNNRQEIKMLKQPLVVAAIAALVATATFSPQALANGDPLLGALVGGSIGAAIGHGVNGRNGAWVGGALGAVTGASIAANAGSYVDRGYYGPQSAYYPPAPVYYGAATTYYQPAPVYYGPPAVVYRPRQVYVPSYPVYGPYYGPRYPAHGRVYAHGRYDWRDHGDHRGR